MIRTIKLMVPTLRNCEDVSKASGLVCRSVDRAGRGQAQVKLVFAGSDRPGSASFFRSQESVFRLVPAWRRRRRLTPHELERETFNRSVDATGHGSA